MTNQETRTAEPRGTVLCIEDSAINMAFVEGVLADMPGISLVKAITAAEGVEMARSQRPDLVLLDMHLPDLGGLEVVRILNEEIANGLKVVILTADSLSMDVIKAMSLGAREYWVKPIDALRLREGVVRHLRGSFAGTA